MKIPYRSLKGYRQHAMPHVDGMRSVQGFFLSWAQNIHPCILDNGGFKLLAAMQLSP